MIAYLDLKAKLFDQTPSNVLLIKKQIPEATWARSAEEWKSNNIFAIKGKDAIKILSSSSYREDDGGLGTSYNVVKVFDISQTTALNRTMEVLMKTNVRIIIKKIDFYSVLNGGIYNEICKEEDYMCFIICCSHSCLYALDPWL